MLLPDSISELQALRLMIDAKLQLLICGDPRECVNAPVVFGQFSAAAPKAVESADAR